MITAQLTHNCNFFVLADGEMFGPLCGIVGENSQISVWLPSSTTRPAGRR
jgi:hypothetical protein